MRTAFKILAGGVLGAVVVHVAAVLWFPKFIGGDVWAAIEGFGPEGAFHLLPQPQPGGQPTPSLDPRMVNATCRFRLDEGPVRITAALEGTFWSVAVYDDTGRNLYSLNDRSAGRSLLDLFLIRPADLVALQREGAPILEEAVVVDLPIDRGIALIRAFYENPALLEPRMAMLASASCGAGMPVLGRADPPLAAAP